MKSYIVMGHTGEHSDYFQWLVASYTDPERAISHRDLANEQAKKFDGDHWEKRRGRSREAFAELRRGQRGATSPYDPSLRIDYTGAWYTVLVVDLDPDSFKNLDRVTLFQEGGN